MSLPHSMFSNASRVVPIVSPHLVQVTEVAKPLASAPLNSAVASGRLRGRSSCFPVGSVVEGQPGGKSADDDPVLFGNDLTARPLYFPSAARHRRMTPHGGTSSIAFNVHFE